ncbi:MAG: MmcQ/YjbR family DNA-binding protein [Chthoniobacterales bacterium]
MNAAQFRRLALSNPEASESSHMNHPDFRVNGKIFATLSADEDYGVVMLSPNEQKHFVETDPTAFSPVPGGWGRKGSTRVHLENVSTTILRAAMTAAWEKRAGARLQKTKRVDA